MSDENLVPVSLEPSYVTRQERARLACEQAGIVWPGTILPPGTALYDSGVDKLKNDRAAWHRLPLAGEVIGLVAQALEAEQRRDYLHNVGALRFRPSDGRIVRIENLVKPNIMGLGYGPHTIRQLVQQIDPLDDAPRGFSSALVYLTDQERALILNERLRRMSSSDDDEATKITLRTRLPHQGDGSRIARAALSKIYGSVTDHDIAQVLGAILAEDKDGRLDYKPGDKRSRFEVIWPSQLPVGTFVVGDIHYMALSITNSETGEGGIRIVPAIVRAACANLTLSTGEGFDDNIRHVGDRNTLLIRLQKAIRRALEDIEPLIAMVTQSARIEVVKWTPAETLKKIAQRYALPAAAAESWINTFKKSYADKGKPTVWSVTAAISEAAHDQPTWTDEADWEKVASDFQSKVVEVVRKGSRQEEALAKALAIN